MLVAVNGTKLIGLLFLSLDFTQTNALLRLSQVYKIAGWSYSQMWALPHEVKPEDSLYMWRCEKCNYRFLEACPFKSYVKVHHGEALWLYAMWSQTGNLFTKTVHNVIIDSRWQVPSRVIWRFTMEKHLIWLYAMWSQTGNLFNIAF